MYKYICVVFLLIIGGLCFPIVSLGNMDSANYTIYADSFDVGGFYSTSTSYDLWGSMGELSASMPTSTSYEIRAGFQAMEKGQLSLSLSDSALSLGSLSVSAVNSDSTTITITSDSETGYVLSVGSAGTSPITAVSDGEVTAGSEEYGCAMGGASAAFANDRSIIAGRVLASSASAIYDDILTLSVKASRASATIYGNKSQSVSLSLSGNF